MGKDKSFSDVLIFRSNAHLIYECYGLIFIPQNVNEHMSFGGVICGF